MLNIYVYTWYEYAITIRFVWWIFLYNPISYKDSQTLRNKRFEMKFPTAWLDINPIIECFQVKTFAFSCNVRTEEYKKNVAVMNEKFRCIIRYLSERYKKHLSWSFKNGTYNLYISFQFRNVSMKITKFFLLH